MEHEDKSPAPLPPPEAGGRARVVSAAAPGGAADESGNRATAPKGASPSEDEADEAEPDAGPADKPPRNRKRPSKGPGSNPNNVRRLRIERMMSKAELARRANVSVLTIDRVEKGYGCRMDTKRKILEALGLSLADRVRVFGDDE